MTFGQAVSEGALVRVTRKVKTVISHCWNQHWKAASAEAAKQDRGDTLEIIKQLTEKMQKIHPKSYKIKN